MIWYWFLCDCVCYVVSLVWFIFHFHKRPTLFNSTPNSALYCFNVMLHIVWHLVGRPPCPSPKSALAHQTNQPPVSSIIKQRHLKLFGHIARAAPTKDHTRTTSIYWPPTSMQTGAVQQVDHASSGFARSSMISNRSLGTGHITENW